MIMQQHNIILAFVLLILNATAQQLWVRQNIGEATNWFYNKNKNKAYVSTKQSVIACLDIENDGNILWRQVLNENEEINDLLMSFDQKSLISLSNGNILRKWRNSDGTLMWENTQYRKTNANDQNNADMQMLQNDKIVLLDNLNTLSLLREDDGVMLWNKKLDRGNQTHQHKLYTDQITKNIYLITFYDNSVNVQQFNLNTGELLKGTNQKYQHECSNSIPKQFEILSFSSDASSSLIVWYECEEDVTPLYAFSFSIESLTITPLSVSFDTPNPSHLQHPWTLNQDKASDKIILKSTQINNNKAPIYYVNIDLKSKSVSLKLNKDSNAHLNIECNDNELKNRGSIMKYWPQSAYSKNRGAMGVMMQDGSLCYINDDNEVDWCREESLSHPLYVFVFDESEDESALCDDDMSEEECELAYHAPFPSLPKRLANDITSWLSLSNIDLNRIKHEINTLLPITSAWIDDTFEVIITVLTNSGKLFGILSTDGKILWSVNLMQLCEDDGGSNNYEIVTSLTIRQHPPHLLVVMGDAVNDRSKLISISSPFHKTPHVHVEDVDYYISSAMVTPWLTDDHLDKITLLMNSKNNSIDIFPFNEGQSKAKKTISKHANSIFYHTFSQANKDLSGFNVMGSGNRVSDLYRTNMLWSKSFVNNENERIVDIVFSPRNQLVVNAVYRTGERGALYKYLNPHLVAIATIENGATKNKMHVYLIDGVTGRVVLHQYHSNVDVESPVSLLIYENKFIYSFWNSYTLLTEIAVSDLWMTDPLHLPTKGRTPSEGYSYEANPLGEDNKFSAFSVAQPHITSQTYNFQAVIDKLLCPSNTRYSVSSKWVVAKLSTGSIIQIDGKWLNTRRPVSHEPTQANREEGLIGYRKYIPFNSLWILSEHNTLDRVKTAISVGSAIESASLLFAYGSLDLFYTTMTPSNNFDTIPPDFDYIMLFLILSGVVVAIFVLKYMVQSKKISKEWK